MIPRLVAVRRLLGSVAIAALVVSACASDDPRPSDDGGVPEAATNSDSADEASGSADEPSGGAPDDGDGDDAAVCWSATPSTDGPLGFVDVTEEAGLVEPLTGMYGHAAAIADIDGDGWTDLFVAGFADRPEEDYKVRGADGPSPDRLLLGSDSGFEVDDSFPGQLARTSGATFADLDNDGDLDIVATRNPRGDDEIGRRSTVVYERDGDEWSIGEEFAADVGGRSVAAIDIDRDGLVDLAIAGDRFGAGPSRLFRNEGDLKFVDATSAWGMPADVETLALATVDLDGDGWVDIVFSGDRRVLLGGEDGFSVVEQPILEWELYGEEDDPAGIAVGDLDRDGRPDLVVGHHFNSTVDEGTQVPVRVVLNRSDEGSVELVDVTEEVRSPPLTTKSPHVALSDVDNDGFLDIVTSAASADGSPLILRHTGDANVEFDTIGEPGDGSYWVTGATDDFDHDGRVDAFMVAWEPGTASPMFANRSGAGHWIEIAGLEPDDRIELRTGGDVAQAWAQSTTGYAAGHSSSVRFGLGARRIDGPVEIAVIGATGTVTFRAPSDAAVAAATCGAE